LAGILSQHDDAERLGCRTSRRRQDERVT
jgi:hypothetical protein